MTVDKLPDLNPPPFGDVLDPARPILSFAWYAPEAHRAAAHSHPRAHIIYPDSGAYWVVTPEGKWLAPAGQAIWIPPRVHHEVYSHGRGRTRILFVDPSVADGLPERCGTVKVSALLQELILRAVAYGNDYPAGGPAARLAQVVLDELALMDLAPLLLPLGTDPRLVRAMAMLIAEPSLHDDLEAVARQSGASLRTLARLFRKETGMTFSQWKTRLLLVESTERLARGASVTEVAFELGYNNVSSFVYMFRTNLGVPPGRYRAREEGTAVAAAT